MADIPGSTATRAGLRLDPNSTFGQFERDGDSDWCRVQLQRGTNYAFNADIDLEAPFSEDVVSLRFRLRDASGRVLEEDTAETYDGYDAGFDYRADASGTYFLEVVGSQADYGLRAFADAPPDLRTTSEVEVGEPRRVSFFYGGDVDTYAVDLVGGRVYDFDATGSGGDPSVSLLDGDGDVLVAPTQQPIEGFEAPSSGRYFLRAADETGQSRYEYTLSAEEAGGGGPGPRVVRLTEGDDEFSEYDLPRTVLGLGGDDDISAFGEGSEVFGGAGDDVLFAGGGSTVDGGPGGDSIDTFGGMADGGAGDDRINLNGGDSTVRGGAGRDTFSAFNAGRDTLADFTQGQDRISVEFLARSSDLSPVDPFEFVGTRGFDGAGQVR